MKRVHAAAKKTVAKDTKKPRTEVMSGMNEAAQAAEEDWKELELSKGARNTVKEFLLEHYEKAGWKKLAKMIAGRPYVTGLKAKKAVKKNDEDDED